MTDPYKVLGISPTATDDEIKKAYRQLAKQYHPDNYINNPLADLAAQKMKEINEAYDTITRQRSYGSSSGNTGGAYTGAGSGSTGGGDIYYRVRQMISSHRTEEAEVLLQRIPESEKNAQWHFLMGHVLYQKGWLQDARNEMETACRLDPYNAEYRAGLDSMNTGYSQSPYSRNVGAGGCNGCDICTGLCIADQCCECMGGDLIGCC